MSQLRDQLKATRPPEITSVPHDLREQILTAAFTEGEKPKPLGDRQSGRRHWWRPAPVLVAGFLGFAGVAAAAGLAVSQATKDQSQQLAGEPTVDPGGQGVRGSALQAEISRLQAATPYPPGVVDEIPGRSLEGVAIGSVRVVVEQRANCLWQRYWVQAARSGDQRAMNDAATILRQSVLWPTFKTQRGEGGETARAVAEQAERGRRELAAFETRMDGQCAGVFSTPAP